MVDSVQFTLWFRLAANGGCLRVKDITDGFGAVCLPFALNRKYPNAEKE